MKRREFSIRALRYWWADAAIAEEAQRLRRQLRIVDLGCGEGGVRGFCAGDDYWIGLDHSLFRPYLVDAGYQELHSCDLNGLLPLSDSVADIAVCLHVLEHLDDPEFTLREIRRILRPGGTLLVGTPVVPACLARIRELQFRNEMRIGKRFRGRHHVHAFSVPAWRALARRTGFEIEFLAGLYLIRTSGSFIEDFRWWARLNQLWGALLPSLGNEVCLQLRQRPLGEFQATAR